MKFKATHRLTTPQGKKILVLNHEDGFYTKQDWNTQSAPSYVIENGVCVLNDCSDAGDYAGELKEIRRRKKA